MARHRSFSRAAAQLGLSQPAVSQAIGRLERLLGFRLFERTSREVRLSTAGRTLLPYAEALLEAAAALSVTATRLALPATPTIRLAYPRIAGALVARVARRLARREPPIELELRPAGWSAATVDLAAGAVPAAILSAPFPPGLNTTARFHVTVGHLAVPVDDPLARQARIRPEQLGRHEVLMPRNRPPGSMWARLAARLPGPRQHTMADDIDDFAAALDLVAAGAGLLPTPNLIVQTVRRGDIQFIPLDAGELRVTYALAWSPERATPELMALVQTLQAALRTR